MCFLFDRKQCCKSLMDRKIDTNNRIETFKNFAIIPKNSEVLNVFKGNFSKCHSFSKIIFFMTRFILPTDYYAF